MKTHNENRSYEQLVRQVEALADENQRLRAAAPDADVQRLIHDLHVHKAQLEAQNQELRTAYQALEESRTLYAELYDFAPIGYCTFDLDGRIEAVNLTGASLLGCERGHLIGRRFVNVGVDDRPAFQEHLRLCAEAPTPVRVELTVSRPDRSMVLELLTSMATVDGGRRVFRSAMSEISERRHSETERASLIARERVAFTEAMRANRAKDVFLAAVSHELRTPLTAMMMWTGVLRNTKDDPSTRVRSLDAIDTGLRSLTSLVNQLIDTALLAEGRLRVARVPVVFGPIVRASLEALTPSADAKGVIMTVEIADEATVLGDAERLRQVVDNLITNAVKFTPRGGRVSTRLESQSDKVMLRVSDNGEGIAPEVLARVFEAFFQEDGSTTRSHGGMGLGLSIVRELVAALGGTIEVESAGKSRGATFSVRLTKAPAAT